MAFLRKVSEDILDHDHGAIHHQAYGYGQPAQGHEVCRKSGNDKNTSFLKGFRHSMKAGVDQLRPVVEGFYLYAVRQDIATIDFPDLFFDPRHNILAASSPYHHNDSGYGLTPPILYNRSLPRLRAEIYLCNIPDKYGHTTVGPDHDIADILQRLDNTDTSYDILLRRMFEDVSSCVCIICGNRLEHFLQCKTVFSQAVGVYNNLILFHIAAEGIDICNPGNGFEHRPYDPVLYCPELREVVNLTCTLTIPFRGGEMGGSDWFFQRILVYLPETCGYRPHRRLNTCRQFFFCLDQSFKDELPCKIDIHVVLKNDSYHGESEF